MYFVRLVLLCCILTFASGANILGVFPSPGYSQFLLAERLMLELVSRGHQVTVISAFSPTKTVNNYTEISIVGFADVFGKGINAYDLQEHYDLTNMFFSYTGLGLGMTEYLLAHPNVQDLINSNASFDLVIVEIFWNEAHIGFAHHFNAPLVLFSSIAASEWTNCLVANPSPPSYVSHTFAGYSSEMNMLQRARNLIFYSFELFLKHFVMLPKQNKLLLKYFPNAPHLEEVLYNASIVLLNSHPSVTEPVPLVPNMIEIGGFFPVPESLSSDLKKFLDDASEGVIFFSMGSNVKSKDMPEGLKKGILKTFSTLKQKVVWKFEDKSLWNIPENVFMRKWLPQRGILAHPNVKLFISHCGMGSTLEAVFYGVPLICIPIYGDQKMNAAISVKNGIARLLPYKELSGNSLSEAITDVLYNSNYAKEMKKRSTWMHDRSEDPMSTAMYWIEFVIRYGGAPHLRTAAMRLRWYEYAYLDALLYIILIVATAKYMLSRAVAAFTKPSGTDVPKRNKPKTH